MIYYKAFIGSILDWQYCETDIHEYDTADQYDVYW